MDLNVKIKGDGFPILCLHGHPGSANCMSVFADRLCDRFQVICPDLRGYGQSHSDRTFQMQDHLLDLEALLQKLKIQYCLLLGWSLGGIIALELGLRQPETFTGMILIATAARPQRNHPPVTWPDLFYTSLCLVINRIKPGMQWNIDLFGKRSLYRYLMQQHTSTAYRYLAREGMPAYFQTSQAANQALNAALQSGYNRLAEMSQIQCPCLLLAGQDDRHITAASSRETADRIENCQWQCYPNTAHLFPWEIPGTMLEDIERWLALHPQIVK